MLEPEVAPKTEQHSRHSCRKEQPHIDVTKNIASYSDYLYLGLHPHLNCVLTALRVSKIE